MSAREKALALRAEIVRQIADIDTFIRLYDEFNEPQRPPAAQTEAGRLEVAAVTPASVESVAAAEGAHNPTSAASSPESTAARMDVRPSPEGLPEATVTGAGTQAPPVDTVQEPPAPTVVAAQSADAATREDADAAAPDLITEKAVAPPLAGEDRPPASPAPTLRQLVAPLMSEHPDWTPLQIAEAIDRPRGSVAATMSLLRREAAEPVVEPPAPDHQPEAERPPRLNSVPVVQPASPGRGSVIIDKPISHPKGRLFWLKNEDGAYLNRFCVGFTRDRREAWTGTHDQLRGCRRAFAIARDLSESVVEKEPVRI